MNEKAPATGLFYFKQFFTFTFIKYDYRTGFWIGLFQQLWKLVIFLTKKLLSMRKLFALLLVASVVLSACEEETPDPCDGVQCFNGGYCQSGQCFCPSGFTGTNCQTPVVTDPCSGVFCLNGGNCINGNCLCAPGYTGNLCENQLPAQSVRITKMQALKWPQTTSSGGGWDVFPSSGPDIYLEIRVYGTTTNLYNHTTIPDVTNTSVPLTFTTGFPLSVNPSQDYSFILFDDDYSFGSEQMANMYFNFATYDDGFPSELTLTTSDGKLSFKFFITWIH